VRSARGRGRLAAERRGFTPALRWVAPGFAATWRGIVSKDLEQCLQPLQDMGRSVGHLQPSGGGLLDEIHAEHGGAAELLGQTGFPFTWSRHSANFASTSSGAERRPKRQDAAHGQQGNPSEPGA